jgi:hypothetical protein
MSKKTKPKPKPAQQFTGVTLDQWKSDHENIRWCQTSPHFQVICSVVLNEMQRAAAPEQGCSEGRAYGRVEGYMSALEVLRDMGRPPVKPVLPISPTHDEPPDQSFKTQDVVD